MKPHILIHNAVSVDGRIDWFKANIEKFYDLTSNWNEDATLTGSETLLAAYENAGTEAIDEEIAEKDPDDTRPLLIVVDSRGRLKVWHQLKREPYWRDAIALVSQSTPRAYIDYLQGQKVEYITAGADKVDLKQALEEVNSKYGIEHIRVDSGGTLNGVLLRAGLVDEVSLLVHPYLVGGMSPRSMFRASDLQSDQGVINLHLVKVNIVEKDYAWMHYEVVRET
jgi:2,5-diamino-6-(ribosylamino)-4(3H)-pyrimidinone 5'-phosphate reductase